MNAEQGTKPADRNNRLIIVVDGDSRDRFATGMLLQRFEYSPYPVASAEEALQIASITRPSLVITEMKLPGMSGAALLKRLKQEPPTKDVPVIVLTSIKEPEERSLCRLAGCEVFLQKPVSPEELYRAVQEAVEPTPRRYLRLTTLLPVRVADAGPGGRELHGCSVTALSENGLYLHAVDPPHVGSRIEVAFQAAGRMIAAQASVRYRFEAGQGPLKLPGIGVTFVDISDGDRQAIREFIHQHMTDGIPEGRQ